MIKLIIKNNPNIFLVLTLLILISCEDKKNPPTVEIGDDIIPEEQITLENCIGEIDTDVPEFYKKYFKCVDIELTENGVMLTTDGVPPHKSWYFSDQHPNKITFSSQGSGYYQNPNRILSQSIKITIPLQPIPKNIQIDEVAVDGLLNSDIHEYSMGAVGIALDGVSLFNSLAGPGDDIENEKYSFDFYSGHPEMSGAYHYHSTTKGPLEVLEHNNLVSSSNFGEAEIEIYGIMCDGTVVLGCLELDSSAPNALGLDAQNGHVHDLIDESGNTHFEERYHTHICPDQLTNHKFTPEIQYYEDCNRSF